MQLLITQVTVCLQLVGSHLVIKVSTYVNFSVEYLAKMQGKLKEKSIICMCGTSKKLTSGVGTPRNSNNSSKLAIQMRQQPRAC